MSTTNGPLNGIRIVDLSNALAGPLCAGILADQGAEVVKVEAPGIGDLLRYLGSQRNGVGAIFAMTNRGKRSIGLNLKNPDSAVVVRELVRSADVIVHNFRPGVAERLGVGYEDVRRHREDVIYLSISGFGSEGPFAGKRAYDNVIQAFSGLAHVQADAETEEPTFVYQVLADKITSITAGQAICAALFARAQGRGGQHVKVSLLDSMLSFLWLDSSGAESFLEDGADPGLPILKGARLMRLKNGWATISPISDSEFFGMCDAFGLDISGNAEVETIAARMSNPEAMRAVMSSIHGAAIRWDVDEALERLDERDVPCAKVMALEDLPDHPQVSANGIFVETTHPVAGRMRQARPAAVFSVTPAGVGAAAPCVGEHTDEILRELGLGEQISRLRERGVVS